MGNRSVYYISNLIASRRCRWLRGIFHHESSMISKFNHNVQGHSVGWDARDLWRWNVFEHPCNAAYRNPPPTLNYSLHQAQLQQTNWCTLPYVPCATINDSKLADHDLHSNINRYVNCRRLLILIILRSTFRRNADAMIFQCVAQDWIHFTTFYMNSNAISVAVILVQQKTNFKSFTFLIKSGSFVGGWETLFSLTAE